MWQEINIMLFGSKSSHALLRTDIRKMGAKIDYEMILEEFVEKQNKTSRMKRLNAQCNIRFHDANAKASYSNL